VISKNGTWAQKDRFDNYDRIGYHIDIKGNRTLTSEGLIHYSKKGVQIAPARCKGIDY
jgi:hypothetical protein